MFVKGIEAERRDVPGFVRHVCKQALYDILVDNDVARALENCKNFIRRLVAGKWSLSEMVMTGVRLTLTLKYLRNGLEYHSV